MSGPASERGDHHMWSILQPRRPMQRPSRPARNHRRRRMTIEPLEGRLVLSWDGIPPATIPVPAAAVGVTLNNWNDAQGGSSIVRNEVDYYTLVAPSSGNYTFEAAP